MAHLYVNGDCHLGSSDGRIYTAFPGKVRDDSARGVRISVVGDGDGECEVRLCVVLELDIRHMP